MKKFLLPLLLFLTTLAGAQQTINCTLSSTKALAITSLVCTPAPVNGFTVTFPASVFDVAVTVSPSAATVATGAQQQFSATVFNATNTSVTWTATGGTVSPTGSYTAGNTPGTFSVTATSVQDPTKSNSATVTITLTPPPPPTVVSVSVTPPNQVIDVGLSGGYIATATYSDNSNKDVTGGAIWASSNTSVATVSAAADPQPVLCTSVVGSTTVSAVFSGITGSTSQSCINPLVSIAIAPLAPTVNVNTSAAYIATGTFFDGTTKDITTQATWSSSVPLVVTMASTVTDPQLGTCARTGSSVVKATIGSIVSNSVTQSCVNPLVSISLTPASTSITVNTTANYVVTGTFADGSTQNVTTSAQYTSSASTIVTMGSPVTNPEVGTCNNIVGSSTITATIGALSDTSTQACVAVAPPPTLVSISIKPTNPTVNVSVTASYLATGTFSDGTTQDVTASSVWASSAPTVVSMASPVVTPETGLCKIVGPSNITATIGAVVSNTAVQTCVNPLVSLKVNPVNPSVNTGSSISYTATGTFADGSTQNVTSSATWVAGTPAVVTMASPVVNPETGACTALGGTSTVTATIGAISNATTQTCVIPPPTPVSLTVTPASPTLAVGSTVNYIATLKFSDNSTQNVTASSTWVSGTPSVVTVGSPVTNPETGACTLVGTSVVTATYAPASLSGHTTQTCTAAATSAAYNPYCGAGNVPLFGSTDGPATLPTRCINTAEASTPAPGAHTTVANGANLQTALNAANCGDTLQLAAGATFSGTFTFPNKACDSTHWIIVRTATADSLLPPEGSQLTPCYAGVSSLPGRPVLPCSGTPPVLTAKIVQPTGNNSGPIVFASGANHYRIGPGIEITRTSGTGIVFQMVWVPSGTASNIIFDRVWLHGVAQDETKTGILTNGMSFMGLVDSYTSDFHCNSGATGVCTDSKVAGGATSSTVDGPFKFEGNYLEAAGENIIFGGGSATATPTDIEIDRNLFSKPLIWLAGQPGFVGATDGSPFIVKNLLEFKNFKRALVEGNIFQYSWGGYSQPGYMILLAPKNQAGGCPICQVTDITFRYNTLSHAGGGFQIENVPDDGGQIGMDGERYSIHDITIDDIDKTLFAGTPGSSNGNLIQIISEWPVSGEISHVLINHITGFPDPSSKIFPVSTQVTYPKMQDINITNSIFGQAQFPVWSSAGGTTDCSVSLGPLTIFNACFSPYTYNHNAMINTAAGACNGSACTAASWPSGNFFPATAAAVQFTNFNNANFGNLTGANYTLLSSSPFHNAGSDGKDLGACISCINAAIAGVAGTNPPPTPPPPPPPPPPGGSWVLQNTGVATHVRQIAFDNSNRWYIVDRTAGAFVSTNQGTSWTPINTGLANTNGWTITYDGTHNLMFLALMSTSGTPVMLYRSTIPVTSWTAVTLPSSLHSTSVGNFTGVTITSNGTLIYGVQNGSQNGSLSSCGSAYSTNAGVTWTAATCNAPLSVEGQWASFWNPITSEVWIGMEQYGVFRSTDNGHTYTAASLPFSGINPSGGAWGNAQGLMYANPAGTMLMAGQGGIFMQSGSGPVYTWTQRLSTGSNAVTRTIGRDAAGTLYWGHSNSSTTPSVWKPTVWQSFDGGLTWAKTAVTGIPDGLEAWQFITNPNDNHLYANVQNGTGNTGAIYKF